jgi:predicted nucleic acid-binding protein
VTSISPWRASRDVLVDSSAFNALLNVRDEHHHEAAVIMGQLAAARTPILTTNHIVAEAHALILTRGHIGLGIYFLREVAGSAIPIMHATAEDEQRGIDIVLRYTDKRFSLTEVIRLDVM